MPAMYACSTSPWDFSRTHFVDETITMSGSDSFMAGRSQGCMTTELSPDGWSPAQASKDSEVSCADPLIQPATTPASLAGLGISQSTQAIADVPCRLVGGPCASRQARGKLISKQFQICSAPFGWRQILDHEVSSPRLAYMMDDFWSHATTKARPTQKRRASLLQPLVRIPPRFRLQNLF